MSLKSIARIGLCLVVLIAVVGIASAGNDTITTYTNRDMKEAQAIWDGSGMGLIIALIALSIKYMLPIIGVLLLAVVIVAGLMHNTTVHKGALQGMFIIIGVLLLWQIFIAVVTSMTPDISTIAFK